MLKVQEYLRTPDKNLASLEAEFGISATASPLNEPLVALNYCQIDSYKHRFHPIVRECRGLVLETGTWNLVAKAFNRFFNVGENSADEVSFDWSSFAAQEKLDGSLCIVYRYKGSVRVNTRASFGIGSIIQGDSSSPTWEELLWSCLDEKALDEIPDGYTFVFELCSRWNKVVIDYSTPTAYLLTVVDNNTLEELSLESIKLQAEYLNCQSPKLYSLRSKSEVFDYLEKTNRGGTLIEGFVLRDVNGVRLKTKCEKYLGLHRIRGESGNIYMAKNLIPFILKGETEELFAYFPETKPKVQDLQEKIWLNLEVLKLCWKNAPHDASQKEFALYVQRVLKGNPFAGLMFAARKEGKDITKKFYESQDLITKVLT